MKYRLLATCCDCGAILPRPRDTAQRRCYYCFRKFLKRIKDAKYSSANAIAKSTLDAKEPNP